MAGPLTDGINFKDLGTSPANAASGEIVVFVDGNILKIRRSSGAALALLLSGLVVDADIAAGAAIALSKLAVDPLARANHTGTQLASTVSNFDTQVRTNRLDQMTTPTAAVAWGSQRITGLADPSSLQDAATKNYVDAVAAGLDPKQSVRVATTANITLSGTQTIDGVAVIATDRVLVKDQSTGANNGIYVCAAGAWSRASDADVSAEVTGGMYVWVNEGTANGDTGWVLTTNDPITLATTALVFTQFSGLGQVTAGAALTKSGNTLDVAVDGTTIEVNADALRLKAAGVGISHLSATGTPSGTTFLRGDNTWATPAGGGGSTPDAFLIYMAQNFR